MPAMGALMGGMALLTGVSFLVVSGIAIMAWRRRDRGESSEDSTKPGR